MQFSILDWYWMTFLKHLLEALQEFNFKVQFRFAWNDAQGLYLLYFLSDFRLKWSQEWALDLDLPMAKQGLSQETRINWKYGYWRKNRTIFITEKKAKILLAF